jgi:tetratricopeptide (TPR) repeat protein
MGPGEVIDERFRIERRIASGGMGHVHRARDLRTGGLVALKLLHGRGNERPARFQREVEALLALDHPGIVRYVADGTTADGTPYLAMEWLEGVTLSERLAGGPLGVGESVELCARMAAALAVVHARGFIHRDLKPSNVFLVGGDVAGAKIVDFGLARLGRRRGELTTPGTVLGTVGYLSPEQARGDPHVDARADVFALGCVLFRCVTGKKPFAGDDDLSVLLKIIVEDPPRLRDLCAAAPAALEDLVARMLAKAPAARPRDGAAIAAEIAAIAAGAPPGSLRARPPEIGARERRVMGLVLTRDPAAAQGAAGGSAGRLQQTVERHRGQLELLADGSSLVVLTSDGEAIDLAARAARCALSIHAVLPAAPVVVVSGRAELSGEALAGELIDRAVAMLRGGSAAPPAPGILVDEVTAGLLGPGFVVEGGRLTGERESLDAARTMLGRAAPFVGRDREIAALEAAYVRCVTEPSSGVVLVTAPAGMGKSRLSAELLRRLRQRVDPPAVWIGRGDPMGAGSAFGMIGRALRRAIGLDEGAPIEARRAAIRERAALREPRPAEAARVAEFLGEIVGTPFPASAGVQVRAARRDAMLLGDQMRRAFEDFLRAECSARPLVLVLEDLQWGDLPTVKLVDAALRHLDTRPFFVLAIGRPEVHQVFPGLWAGRGVEEVHLAPLPRRDGGKLARAVLGSAARDDEVDRIVDRADGNALHLEELIRAVAEGRGAAVPETVIAMVQARLEGRSDEERRVLRAASVFGQTFREDGVAALLGGAPPGPWLDALAEGELIVPSDEGQAAGARAHRFRHALLREAAYGMLTEGDRALGHRLAAEHLAAAGETDATALAEHFERGGDPGRAAAWYARAAEQAFEGNDLDAALARAARGLACAEDPDGALAGEIDLIRTRASRWAGRNQEAEEAAVQAMRKLPRGSALWCEAAAEVVYLAGKLGHTDRMLSGAGALLALGDAEGGSGGPADEAAASYAIALARAAMTLQLSAGRQAQVEVLLERADEAAERAAGDPAVVGQVQWARALRVLAAGDVSTFLGLVQASRERLELAGDLRSGIIQALNAGHGLLQLGAYEEAERILGEAARRADRMNLGNARSYAKLNLGLALLGLGRLADARRVEEEAIALFTAQADRPLLSTARTYLARVLAAQGERDAAALGCLVVADDRGAPPALRAQALAVLAEILLAEGRAEGALARAEAAMSLLTSLDGIEEGESRIRLVHAEALAAAGDRAAAEAALADARDRLLARAAQVVDPALRRSLLERVPENARTLALARAWLA